MEEYAADYEFSKVYNVKAVYMYDTEYSEKVRISSVRKSTPWLKVKD